MPGTLRPPSLGTARCPLRCTRSPALRLPPHWTPRPFRSPAGRVGTSRRGLLLVRTVPWGKPGATRDPKPCPRASSRAPRRALASQGGGRRSSRHSAARSGLRSGQGPSVRPGSPSRARACARALRCPQSWQPAPRSAAAERAPAAASVPGRRGLAGARAYGPQGAKPKADESPRRGAPSPAGPRGRGAPGAACLRGRARGAAGRGAGPGRRIRGSRRPPRPRAPGPGGGCAVEGESGRGRAGSLPAAGTAGGPGRPCWYSGHSRSPDLPAELGRPGALHGRPPPPRAVSPRLRGRRRLASPARPLLSRSPGPPPPP